MYKIGFVGSAGDFSLRPLKALLKTEHKIAFIGVDGIKQKPVGDPRFQIIQTTSHYIESLAYQYQIPIIDFQMPQQPLVAQIEEHPIDLLIVACYQHKIAQAILAIPNIAALNLHPSLLPAYRGPVPLFWQFRNGQNAYGVSLHKMDQYFDNGPIVAQQELTFPDGISHQQANQVLADTGVVLINRYLCLLRQHKVIEKIQNSTLASYMGYPSNTDFIINASWSAKRIFNFMRATMHWNRIYPLELHGIIFNLKEALEYRTESMQIFDSGYQINQGIILINCSTGILKARLA